jgi:hypothetical protein
MSHWQSEANDNEALLKHSMGTTSAISKRSPNEEDF